MVFPSYRQHQRSHRYQTVRFQNMNHALNERVPIHRAEQNNVQKVLNNVRQSPASLAAIATKSAGNISQTLSNVQQVLNVLQTAAPIVQEYGPMMKNLPAMYRMMKAFKEVDSDENEMNEELVDHTLLLHEENKQQTPNVEKVEYKTEQRYSKESVPKLYI